MKYERRPNPTRRDILRDGSVALAGGLAAPALLRAAIQADRGAAASRASADAESPDPHAPVKPIEPAGPLLGGDHPTVVEASSDHVINTAGIQPTQLKDMIGRGLEALTGHADVADAWQSILKPDDVIGVKFNRVAQRAINSTEALAGVLIGSLKKAGFDPTRLVIFEAPDSVYKTFGCPVPDAAYGEQVVDFRCGSDVFLSALEPVTALINVPFLKTHHLAVMTACLKNLSHGLIRRPSQFHDNGCDPAIARIVDSPPVRSRIRLNIVNALRVVYRGGSRAAARDMVDHGRLLIARDPVAADAVGFEHLNHIRRRQGTSPLLPSPRIPRYLATAGAIGLGRYDPEQYSVQRVIV
jgi:hypothetical protein